MNSSTTNDFDNLNIIKRYQVFSNGQNQSFNHAIASQEAHVRREMSSMDRSQNYVGYNRYDSRGNERKYSDSQIAGNLRQEYCGNSTYKNRDDYVLSSDWKRMRRK